MDEKEKARAYDEALERAKKLHKDAIDMEEYIRAKQCEIIFPEIGESENEKTKRILHSISSKMSSHLCDIFTEEEYQCFDAWSNAWLEKRDSKESEGEKIRKVLIDYFNRYKEQEECGVKTFYGIPTDNILAWLEKQGEYKPAWSEEDEKERKRVIGLLEGWLSTFKETYYAEDCKRGIDWLKSLRTRLGGK